MKSTEDRLCEYLRNTIINEFRRMKLRCMLGIHKWNNYSSCPSHDDVRKCRYCGVKQKYMADFAAPNWGSDYWGKN